MLSLFWVLLASGSPFVFGNSPPTIIHIIADDLGYNDLGYTNGKKTVTPHINNAIKQGIRLSQYHTYKLCSPTRASIMTGRYPWGVGYYDMKGPEQVPLDFMMLPEVLKNYANYETHAIGKWNLGSFVKDYTPTFRGFDSFFGYYNAALKDYWYHGGSVPGCKHNSSIYPTDLSNSTGANVSSGVQHASNSLNGTYDQEMFTTECVRLIRQHAASSSGKGLYIYLAYQNVHAAGETKDTISGLQPLHAPCNTVDSFYEDTKLDTYKVQGAMLSELDYGVGNVTEALHKAGLPFVLVFSSDNGGPLPHSTNAPLRGGKHTLWDGGVRVVSWVSGPLIPSKQQGSEWNGMAHSSDWYRTFIEGVANTTLPANTGPRVPDGFNLWPHLLHNLTSPRMEIIHQVSNNFTKDLTKDPATIRIGNYKYIAPGSPGDNRIVAWPNKSPTPVPFGSSGSRDAYPGEHGNCRAPNIKTNAKKDIYCPVGCLFDIGGGDVSESHNLINNTKYASVITNMKRRLEEAAKTGPPWAWPFTGALLKEIEQEICAEIEKTSYYEPVRTSGPTSCIYTLQSKCPLPFATYDDCLACTRKYANKPICTPKERQGYCNSTTITSPNFETILNIEMIDKK